MFKPNRILVALTIFGSMMNSTMVFAAPVDISSANVQVSGSVPEIFSLQARGVPGDLDLSPNVVVNDRPLGFFHLKYNIPMASLILSSSTATGLPKLNGVGADAPFAAAMVYQLACNSVDPAVGGAITAATLGGGATDLKSVASALGGGSGIEEDCLLSATWTGTAAALPLAGRYSMTITLTMTST